MNPNPADYAFPAPLTEVRIQWLTEKGVDSQVAAIDLEMVKMKLADEEDGEGWSKTESDETELEYKRWLTLTKMHGKGMVPTRAIDTMWHQHILDTRAYAKDCDQVFGGFLHHYPYFGMRDAQDAQNLEDAFRKTQAHYLAAFKEPLGATSGVNCKRDCQNRCWHACNGDKD